MERTKRKIAQGIFNSVTVTENETETEGAAKWNEGKWRDGAPEALNWGCFYKAAVGMSLWYLFCRHDGTERRRQE